MVLFPDLRRVDLKCYRLIYIRFGIFVWRLNLLGLYTIVLGVLALIVRSALANFKKDASIALTVFYITSYGTGVVVNAIQYAQLSDWVAESPIGTTYLISVVITFFVGLVMTICNATYFENRKDLFTN